MKVILVVWTILLLCFRPSLFGDRYSPLIFVCFVLVTLVLHIAYPPVRAETNKENINQKKVFFAILIAASYFLIQGIILSDTKITVINSSVIIFGTSFCIFSVVRRPNTVETILKAFVLIHVVLSVSAIITILLFLFNGSDISAVPVIGEIVVNPNDFLAETILEKHVIFFPFTAVWSSASLENLYLPRFIGFYREPGMAQIFFFTAYFLTFFLRLRYLKIIRVIVLIGSFLIISTAGFLSFVGGTIALYLFNGKIWQNKAALATKLLIFSCVIYMAFTMSEMGILDKIDSASGKARSESFERGEAQLMQSPIFGQGYFSGFKKDNSGFIVGAEFLGIPGVMYQIGIVGLILYFRVWFLSLRRTANMQTLCFYMPCLLTLLLSQPSYIDVFVWFLVLIDTSKMQFIVG